MIREVDLTSYLPEFMQQYTEPVTALETENPEFTVVWDAVNRILYNHFISTADEYGIRRFEKMLGIYPSSEDTLENRRLRVQNRWSSKIPYTIRILAKKIAELLGGEKYFSITSDFGNHYKMTLVVYSLKQEKIAQEIDYTLNVMLPMNIVSNIIYESGFNGTIYHGAVYEESNILELRQR